MSNVMRTMFRGLIDLKLRVKLMALPGTFTWHSFLDPCFTGSFFEFTPVCLSVCDSFLRVVSLVFFCFFARSQGQRNLCKGRSPIFEENSSFLKIGETGPKCAKNGVFCIFWKILSLAFPGNNLKCKIALLHWYHCKSLT